MFNVLTLVGFHTWLSLIATAAGIVVVAQLLKGKLQPAWTAVFLATAVLTSATGFLFPFNGLLPSHIVGVLALIVLAFGLWALYGAHLSGAWRRIYAISAVISLYFLVFVGIAQAFAKISVLASPSQTPFAAAQAVWLAITVYLAIKAAKAFKRTGAFAAA